MPSYMVCESYPDGGEQEYSVKFKITSRGSGPSNDHPGDPLEIEIDEVRTIPENEVLPPALHNEDWKTEILDNFDFNEHFQAEADAAAEASYDAWRDDRMLGVWDT